MRPLYWAFAYVGTMTIFAAFLYGFRFDAAAPRSNYFFDAALFAVFITVHLGMTRPWFKRAVYRKPEGSLRERQMYVSIAIVTWVTMLILQRPVPGAALALPEWVHFLGLCLMLLCVLAFFEGATFAMINGLLGVPGSAMSHSHGAETPLMTEGSYAKIRHPMYRGALLFALFSLLVHPHTAQLMWALFFGGTFVAFIPFEESQLIAARGEGYRAYMRRTPYRLFPGIW